MRSAACEIFAIVAFIIFAIVVIATAQSPPPLSVHGPLPTGAPEENQFISGHLYAASINPTNKMATWCAYVVTPGMFEGSNSINRNWINGKGRLADICLESQDYEGSDYDMGHLVPLGSVSASRYAYECNFLGVIVPQTPELNRGLWLRLENRVRDLSLQHQKVNVCVGTLYEKRMKRLPKADEPHAVPTHFWALLRYAGRIEVYIMPQDVDRTLGLDDYKSDIEALTLRSGLNF